MSEVKTKPQLTFEPFLSSLLLAPLGRLPTPFTWMLLPGFLGLVVLVNLAQDTFWGVGPSPWAEFQHQLGIEVFGAPHLPLSRDLCSLLLVASVALTMICVRRQWQAIQDCVPRLELNGVLAWSVDNRERIRLLLARLSVPNRRHDLAAVALAAGMALCLSYYLESADAFVGISPQGSASAQLSWAAATYSNWWASWDHPVGAILYVTLVTVGVYVILAQNYVALKSVRVMLAVQEFASFEVDWLNIDGSYGWAPFQEVFRMSYLSMALRAIQIVLLVTFLNLQSPWLLSGIAALWLSFLMVYVAYPYFYLRGYARALKKKALMSLAAEFKRRELSLREPSAESRHFVEEIGRIQSAVVNPMQLARWQSSGFVVVVLLPISLTVVQIVS